jgi:hypothetical protein
MLLPESPQGLELQFTNVGKLRKKDPDAEFDVLKMLINVCAGIAGAILPDKIEPAFHPNHRSLDHFFTTLPQVLASHDQNNSFMSVHWLGRPGRLHRICG